MGRPVHELLLLLVVLSNFWVLGTSRLSGAIRAIALQGTLLALLPLALHPGFSAHLIGLAAGTLLIKAVVLPVLLMRAIREAAVRREMDPLIGFPASMLAGAFAVALSFRIGPRLPLPESSSAMLVPVALATVVIGLLVLTTRRKAISQVVGYLVLENGIYVFGLSQVTRAPFLVEAGVLLDVFVGVFIMGIVVFHINREFDSLDSARLSELRE
jgi:hydrogenase-4 component E